MTTWPNAQPQPLPSGVSRKDAPQLGRGPGDFGEPGGRLVILSRSSQQRLSPR